MAVQNIDPRRCMGCETCVMTCPTDVFRFDDEDQAGDRAVPGRVSDLPHVRESLPRGRDHHHV